MAEDKAKQKPKPLPTYNELFDKAKEKNMELVLPIGNLKSKDHKGLYLSLRKNKKVIDTEPVKISIEAAAIRLKKRLEKDKVI